MFKQSLFFLVTSWSLALALPCSGTSEMRCVGPFHPEVVESVKTIHQLPEARELISQLNQYGRISVATTGNALSSQFGAFWDSDRRIIFVNPSWHQSRGELIGSILFELQNAATATEYEYLEKLATGGKISKDRYIESMERVEYGNSIQAAMMADKGIALGIFPATARKPTYKDFEEHYRVQRMAGHSAWIAHLYDQLAPMHMRRG